MSQHDYVISDATGLAFLADLNLNLAAIVTQNAGTSEPSVTYAGMPWLDTTTTPPTLKRRNQGDSDWELLAIDEIEGLQTALDTITSKDYVDGAVTITPPSNADVTLSAGEAAYGHLILANGSWTTDHNIIVPTEARRYWINNTGAYTATIKPVAGTGIAVAPGTRRPVVCDGTNVVDPLSAFAVLASPTFSGNPTAPTQSQGDNSTKIATTAYVDSLNTTEDYILCLDSKTSGTDGGTATLGAWYPRDIQESVDAGNNVTVASNLITFTNAGTYRFCVSSAFNATGVSQIRLYRTNNTPAVIAYGTPSESNTTYISTSFSKVAGRVNISAGDIWRIEYRVTNTKTTIGLGKAGGWGDEVYTIAEFWKE